MDITFMLTVAVAVLVVFCVYFLFNGMPEIGSKQRRPSRR
jgi:hypothetical protein